MCIAAQLARALEDPSKHWHGQTHMQQRSCTIWYIINMLTTCLVTDIRWGLTLPGRDELLQEEAAKPYTAALKRFSDTVAACNAGTKWKEGSATLGKHLLDELHLDVRFLARHFNCKIHDVRCKAAMKDPLLTSADADLPLPGQALLSQLASLISLLISWSA